MKVYVLLRGLVAAGVLGGMGACAGALLTAPPESTITLFANPPFVSASGGTAVISALVMEPTGTAVPDGTVVQFFTNLGRIDREGRTHDGVARVNFVADTRSGAATILAVSGAARASEADLVRVGNRIVTRIHLRAEPPRITISNSTHVIATVLDEFGNPVRNVPVTFTVESDRFTEFFDTPGPVFTNTNGEAENVLRTRRQTQGLAVVAAEAPGGSGTTPVIARTSIPIL